jgi:MFS family permease
MMNRSVPLIVALALLMETIDATALSTALPAIAQSVNAPILSLKLALATYLISLAALVPASGWVADRYGARRIFVAAMVVFVAGSVLCAMQTSLNGLIAARALQGAGGAMMVPVGRLIVLKSVPKVEMVSAMSYVTVPALVGLRWGHC